MTIPVVLPAMLPNLVQPGTESAQADQARRPIIPVITAVQPYVAIRPRHQDRELSRRQAAYEVWLGLYRGECCLIGANPAMSRRLDVINRRYRRPGEHAGIELDIEV
ncbi:hypothetical protein HNR62_003085 [Oceanisphaera litoralis]|uniref:hypothetical protein n=1 Tax=Oceanisphaera litoralis TaxID=225144 RepID=UPI00195B6448|nr:hypothetical protein [Oceanisphaera litoralis]MBM7457173.1 hypothetical protein [Oceanisphaera litoralis]